MYNVWLTGYNQSETQGKIKAVRGVRQARLKLGNDAGATLRASKSAVEQSADGGRAYIGSTEDEDTARQAAALLREQGCDGEIREAEGPPSPEDQFGDAEHGEPLDAPETVDEVDTEPQDPSHPEVVLSPTTPDQEPERTPSYPACKLALVTLGYAGEPLTAIAALQHQSLIVKDTNPAAAALNKEACQVLLDTFKVQVNQ